MNRIHRLVWNAARCAWQAVCETAAASGKDGQGGAVRRAHRAAGALAVLAAVSASPLALAGPQGGRVTLGGGSIAQSGTITTITQTTQNLAVDWPGFNVGAGETVRFVQPNAQSVALNRVLGTDPSRILGQLSANGQVFLLNPNGILFGSTARIDVGGLVASTMSLSNEDFAAWRLQLRGTGNTTGVSNAGRITTTDGGYVVLAASQVQNTGEITTRLGTTALTAGEHVTLRLQGGSLLGYRIERGALDALVEQAGRISADGGAVLIEAKALDALSSAVVNHTGITQARTVQEREGRIVLLGDMAVGRTNVAGTLDASAPEGGHGGFIETSAAVVKVADTARMTTRSSGGHNGTWVIDPTDFTIAASGGDISGATLSAQLANNDVEVSSTSGAQQGSGHLFVRDTVSWSANRLTLRAQSDIHFYSDLLGSGNAQLSLEFGQATADGAGHDYHLHNASRVDLPEGRNFFTRQGSGGDLLAYQVVTRMVPGGLPGTVSFQEINNDTAARYALGSSLVADRLVNYTPLGGWEGRFTGQFHGLGHTITDLTTAFDESSFPGDRLATFNAGLFSSLAAGSVARDFGLLNGYASLRFFNHGSLDGSVGAVAGVNEGLIDNVYTTGGVNGNNVTRYFGGLVGDNRGVLRRSYFGGWGNSYDTNGTVANRSGLLAGVNTGSIEDAFASGTVGGVPGIGAVANNAGQIHRVHTAGSGNTVIDNIVVRVLDAQQMKTASTFAGWDIGTDADGDSIWRMYEGQSSPVLRDMRRRVNVDTRVTYNGAIQTEGTASGRNAGFHAVTIDGSALGQEVTGGLTIDPAKLTVSSTDVSRAYDGTTSAVGARAVVTAGQLFGGDGLSGGASFAFADSNAGTGKAVHVSGIRVQDGLGGANYVLTLADNTSSTITPAELEIRVNPTSKTYDGTTQASATWSPVRGRLYAGDTLDSVVFNFDTAGAGTGKRLVLGSAVISDGHGGANYTLTLANNAGSSIVPAELVVTANDDRRVTGGQPYQGGNGFTSRGWVAGEDERLLQGGVVYGGTSQGATAVGNYSIVASGLGSPNYTLRFEDGVLAISEATVAFPPPPPLLVPVPVPAPPLSVLPTLPTLPTLPDEGFRAAAHAASASAGAVVVVGCGLRLPPGAPDDHCR